MTHQWLKYDRSGPYAQRRVKAVGMLRRARRLALDGYRTMAVRPHEGCFGRHYSDYTDYRHPVTKRIMRITPSGMKGHLVRRLTNWFNNLQERTS